MLQIGILLLLFRLKSYLFQHLISVRLLLWRIGEPNFKGQLLGIIEDNFFLTIYYLGTFFPLIKPSPMLIIYYVPADLSIFLIPLGFISEAQIDIVWSPR